MKRILQRDQPPALYAPTEGTQDAEFSAETARYAIEPFDEALPPPREPTVRVRQRLRTPGEAAVS